MLDEKELENLTELARMRLAESEKKKLRSDLEKILAYVAELNGVPTEGVLPMSGGTLLVNETRSEEAPRLPGERAREAFPESKGNFLKVPPVFE